MTSNYKEYIKTQEWKEKRDLCIKLANYQCNRCGCKHQLQAHHLTYKNIFKEKQEDIECLCRKYHQKEHHIFLDYKFIPNDGEKFLNYDNHKPIQSKQIAKNNFYKNKRDKIDSELEKKGKLIRKLNKMGLKETGGKKLIYYDYNFLASFLD